MTTTNPGYFTDGAPRLARSNNRSRSWSGAGVAGANNDRSWSGNGTAPIIFYLNNDITGGGFGTGWGQNSQYGAYVWIDSGGGTGCVWSVLSAVYSGYQFFWSAWVSGGVFNTTYAVLNVGAGTTATYPLTISGLDLDAWNWVTAGFCQSGTSFHFVLSAQIYGAGNVLKGQSFVNCDVPIGNSNVQPAATLGDGTDLNGFSMTMPDVPGARRSKLCISKNHQNQGPTYGLLLRPPWNDATVPQGFVDYYYLGTGQTPGPISSITESGGTGNNLSGAYGHIYGDLGPFAG